MTLISTLTPTYNEEDNVEPLIRHLQAIAEQFPEFEFEHVFIDNASTDRTQEILRRLAAADKRIKIIFNNRNFGQMRSPAHGMFQCRGDAVISLSADFQDPPEIIPQLIQKWMEGYPVVIAVKSGSEESSSMYLLRTAYYRLLRKFSETELIEHFTGFGLYERKVLREIEKLHDAHPYFRGMIAELGYHHATVSFRQPLRKHGISKNNLLSLYDYAMRGMTSHSHAPLRFATFVGFIAAGLSFAIGFAYLLYKLIFWQNFAVGMAPVAAGLFFLGAVQLIFLGIMGEYVAAVHLQVRKRPLVVERERINFD